MVIDSVSTLVAVLRRVPVLAPDQVEQIAHDLAPDFTDPKELGDYLVQIDWLTPYQKQALFDGHWADLVLGPYILLSQLGSGGVSEVFKAWDTSRGRDVALKVLRHNLASETEALRQFQRVLETVPRLSHPNIIKTY